ncbi:hypothetical protein AA0119_g612 [Alternaria tenuissima]|jgi:hypothetical protein|uniref:Uncharacterized protein n=2 Tax=Alternaria alternata complex TaxID=187734 RepID=A0A4V1WR58_ALTAL|nr:hypothetical protein AA0115_g823 [Alternaria tenuissima]RYN72803.1 hypothetical protein AA0117_g8252 [Alternaria alternata]RYO09596.1 hypothetical protein AA0119_g612 [Alternaria tenuissima]RYO11851.1 hypothetical protein AA0121_g9573 [Alternaria tenuissima]
MSAATSIELFSTNIPISELPTPTLPNSPGPSDFVISNCSPFGSWSLRPADVAPPYCAYNHNETIPNLSSCCKEGAEIHVYGGCVQYCEVAEEDQEAWKECVIDVFPESDVEGHGFPCYFGGENDYRNQSTSGETATPTESAAEQSESASPDDDEGAANMNRPSLTIVGWMVAFLAVGAGFMA